MDFFTADWHLGHEKIIQYESRPYRDKEDMSRQLIHNAKMTCGPNDRLFILGDFAWWGATHAHVIRDLVSQLSRRLILILGNHDRCTAMQYVEYGFESVHTALEYRDRFVLVHDPAWAEAIPRDKYVLCGHVHSLFRQVRNVLNVGVDVWNYNPVPFETVLGMFEIPV